MESHLNLPVAAVGRLQPPNVTPGTESDALPRCFRVPPSAPAVAGVLEQNQILRINCKFARALPYLTRSVCRTNGYVQTAIGNLDYWEERLPCP